MSISSAFSQVSGTNSTLAIWDEADIEGGNRTILIQDFAMFYANFTQNGTGTPISGSPINCKISFLIGSNWTPSENMSYSSYSKLYRIERQFNQSGNYSYNVLCNGSSSGFDILNTTDSILIQDPVNPVEVILDSPLNQTSDKNGNVEFNCSAFTYNNLVNASIYHNITGMWGKNQTSTISGTFNTSTWTLSNIPNGTYAWSCLAFDDEGFSAFGENFTLRIGSDADFPIVILSEPDDGAILSEGAVLFGFNATDATSAVNSCSMIINGKQNKSISPVSEASTRFFGLAGLRDGSYNWSVNCTDLSTEANVGASSTRSFVILDNVSPIVSLIRPDNGEIDTTGNITFQYMVADYNYDVSSCKLIIDEVTNKTNSSITEFENLNFTVYNLGYGSYQWRVNCTDTSPSANVGSSYSYELIVNKKPYVALNAPTYGTGDNDGDITFNYSVMDDGLIRNCTLYHNMSGTFLPNLSNTFVQTNASLTFTLENTPDGAFDWNVVCYDDARVPNYDWGGFSNFILEVEKEPPTVSTIPSLFWKEDYYLMLNLSNYFSDPKGDSLSYIASFTGNVTVSIDNSTSIVVLESGKNWWGNVTVVFTAFDEHGMNVSSNNATFTVLEGSDNKPRFTHLTPANNTVDGDGYLFFDCNATDDLGLVNMSFYFNTTGNLTLQDTKPLSGLNSGASFNVTNLSNGHYQWACVAYDNASQEQWEEVRDVNVSVDVELQFFIPNYMVNDVNTTKYVIISYSNLLNNSISLGNLEIRKSSGEVYLIKNMSGSSKIENDYTIIHPHLVNVTPKLIFNYNFTVNNTASLNYSIKYYFKDSEFEVKHNITITVKNNFIFNMT